ncbi:MAG TPA: hypothetical protein VHW45_20115 [Candidatus Sulfotelmatobacter sp.]|jgi:hypothetical protein|nr:hypothetical protein [Candidatus Sulfotelmatobacter sp.]
MNTALTKLILHLGCGLALLALPSGIWAQTLKATGLFVVVGGAEIPLEPSVGISQLTKSGLLESQVKTHIRQFLAIPGDKSPVRINSSDTQVFLIRMNLALTQDSSVLSALVPELRLLVRKKGERELVQNDITGTIFSAKNRQLSPKIVVDVARQDDHTLRATPQLPLLPGEYAFNTLEEVADPTPQRFTNPTAGVRYRVYCFGVN